MTLYGIQKQQLKHLTKQEYLSLKTLSKLTKNIYNVALYNARQHYFREGEFLNYNSNYHLCKCNENYKLLNANSAQQTIKKVQDIFKSFFALIKLKKSGSYNKNVKIPNYLDKEDFGNLIFAEFNVKNNTFDVPMSYEFKKLNGKININIPSNLKDKKIKEVRIIPKYKARFFEVHWVYEIEPSNEDLNKNNALAIDLGVNNLMTCVTNSGHSFIIDGKKLKSINQYANKENARLQSIKDLQKIDTITRRQISLWTNRNNKINDYINKSIKFVIDYCKFNDIGTIVLGYNADIQNKSNIGKTNNQNFVNIPIGQIKDKLSYMSERSNIKIIIQEESYTSKASFLDGDHIPTYNTIKNITYIFSGKRVKRGLYKTANNILINADINGALNILKKANICKIDLTNKAYLSPIRVFINKKKTEALKSATA